MKIILTVLLLSFLNLTLFGYDIEIGDEEITFSEIPETIDEYVEMRNEYAVTPTGGAAMFVIAMWIYSENEDLGEDCMTAILVNDGTMLTDDKDGYKGKTPNSSSQYLLKYINQYEGLPESYLAGSNPDNGYTPDGPPYMVEAFTNRFSILSETEVKVFVECSGASSARPITMSENTRGLWKVSGFSSLVVGIMPPTVYDDGDDI